MQGHYNVLFLCTGNSARSIMAEAILNQKGRPNFTAYSAGSHPSGSSSPGGAAATGIGTPPDDGLRSKSWDEFAKPDAPKLDFVFTVCDNAANEVCPVWPGQPMTAHWGIPDPAAVQGTPEQVEKAFREAFFLLDRRISLFLSLPLSTLDQFLAQEGNRQHRAAMNRTRASDQNDHQCDIPSQLPGSLPDAWIFAAMLVGVAPDGRCPESSLF